MEKFIYCLSFLSLYFVFNSGCSKNDNPIQISDSDWDNPNNKTVVYDVYPSSNYTSFYNYNSTFYAFISDTVSFNQYLTFTPGTNDSTSLPSSVFDLYYSVLVSDKWVDRVVDYDVEGVYLFNKKLYLKYQRTEFKTEFNNDLPTSFLYVLIRRSQADTLILVENNIEINRYSIRNSY